MSAAGPTIASLAALLWPHGSNVNVPGVQTADRLADIPCER